MKTPYFLVDEALLEKNCQILDGVQQRTGCRILLALKGFAMFSVFPLVRQYLQGVCASSLFEARLGAEEFGREVHTFAPAYGEDEFAEIVRYSSHINFNSFAQWRKYRPQVGDRICGLRVNPGYSEVSTALYDPCAPKSRLGILERDFCADDLEGISGLHFHAMCEQNSDTLERILEHFEAKFGRYLDGMTWVNFGGGHHITRPDYDIDRLCRLIDSFQSRYDLQVYLEPGEAIALQTGVLITSVLDIVHNEMPIAILNTSAEAHMPDVLAMPYRPEIVGAGTPQEFAHTYRLAGMTCLAGDVIGDYSFSEPLKPGDEIVLCDMAHYTMVKTTMFNGVPHPAIAIKEKSGNVRLVRRFGYEDYRNRLS